MPYVERLHALRREYGRADEPFEILLALMDVPTVDLYRRAEDIGDHRGDVRAVDGGGRASIRRT